ncbi:MAG: MBL fold metallo-hydrolase [Ignavibacteriales bacterium]
MAGFRFCSLSSSSIHGNSYFVETPGGVRLLVDCGVPIRRLERYLDGMGVSPPSISAVFITHGHRDHTAALDLRTPFAEKYGVPVYATRGFWDSWTPRGDLDQGLRHIVVPGTPVDFGQCNVTAFLKPHDCAEPVGYTVRCGDRSLSIVTDLGCVPASVAEAVRDSEYLVFESNHDREMELNSGRSRWLIYRVLSDIGHLSNEQTAHALSRIASACTRVVLLSHLSLECNSPEIALHTAVPALSRRSAARLEVAPPDRPSAMFGDD